MNALDQARRKAYLRLIPLLFLGFVIAYIDRSNLAIAKLTMGKSLPQFGEDVFGTAAGMFFLGYVLLEIPGTLLVERWSARKWLGRIMVSWGVVAALQAFVTTPFQFYSVRFLLGLAEAGFFPGVIVYLSHWFPARDRGRAVALFLTGTAAAQIINPKISNLLLKIGTDEVIAGVTVHHPIVWGLQGWQWVFVFWALPAVVLGVIFVWILPDRPKDAKWLTPDQRQALESILAAEKASYGDTAHMPILKALRTPRVLLISVAYMLAVVMFYGVEFFTPTILKRWYGMGMDQLTWLLLIPAGGSFVSTILAGWSSDRHGERRFHTAVPLLIAAAALALAPLSRGNLAFTMVLFTLATIGVKAYLPAFWCLPSAFLTASAAAASTGFINSMGNLGGFIGPHFIGSLEKTTGTFEAGLYFIAVAGLLAAIVVFVVATMIARPARPPAQG